MNVLICGGTGFIGTQLAAFLSQQGHSITIQSRHPSSVNPSYQAIQALGELTEQSSPDVVINLVGEAIADKRWSQAQKQTLISSRLMATQAIVEHFARSSHKPELLINGSAIGFYGIQSSDEAIDESALPDNSFSSELCKQWEEAALQAKQLGIRTCLLRTGIVLGENGGALKKMLLPFKLGLGGKIGTGQQWMPWIHMADLIGIIHHVIQNKQISGPINATAPKPVTNHGFTKILGKVLKRPTFMDMPAFVIGLLMGQMGKELLLSGKKVVPEKALQSGYQFQFKYLEPALKAILNP